MKDCEGQSRRDDEPITWWQFDREMKHRDKLEEERRSALQTAMNLRATQLLTSHRILVAVLAALAIVMQVVLLFYRKG